MPYLFPIGDYAFLIVSSIRNLCYYGKWILQESLKSLVIKVGGMVEGISQGTG
ncbi:hypothetical protein B4168_4248 [Anoxybacillus flavithermus]|nr:hypothetical protein B4168_4248 [Anoxybacillus flavithermus]OAO87686.1 hypothetical protein GT23_1001 [Parageobacillus thermoglucosidasius]